MKKLRALIKYLPPFLLGVLLIAFIMQYDRTVDMLDNVFDGLLFLMGRIIIGFGMAYFLNYPVRFFERKLKFRRWLSLLVTYILFLGFLALMAWIIVPSVTESAKQISTSLSTYYSQVMVLLQGVMDSLPPETAEVMDDSIKNITAAIIGYLRTLLSLDFLGATLGGVSRSLTNIVFGTMISVYAIWDKEKLSEATKRLLMAFTPTHIGEFLLKLSVEADQKFSHYIVGKVWDSVIIGVLAIIVFLIFGLPVAPFLAMVVMVTNMVPYFGPFVGGFICGVVLLGFGPMPCLVGVLLIVVLQCLDGAVIGPKILGDAVGLSPLLIIVSVTIGGDLFGIAGIFFAVPVVGTLKEVVVSRIIDARIAARRAAHIIQASEIPDQPLDGQMSLEDTQRPPE